MSASKHTTSFRGQTPGRIDDLKKKKELIIGFPASFLCYFFFQSRNSFTEYFFLSKCVPSPHFFCVSVLSQRHVPRSACVGWGMTMRHDVPEVISEKISRCGHLHRKGEESLVNSLLLTKLTFAFLDRRQSRLLGCTCCKHVRGTSVHYPF